MTHPVHTVMGHVIEIGEVLVHWRRERESGREVGEGMDGEVTEWVGEWTEWVGEENRQRKRQRVRREEERKVDTHTYQMVSQRQW